MRIVLSEKFSQVDSLLWKTPQDVQELFGVLRRKRMEVSALLHDIEEYKEWDHINWCLFIADYREYLWLPRFLDLDMFNAFTEIIMTSWDDFDYNNFLKFSKSSATASRLPNWYAWPNVSKLIQHQWEYLAQWLVEVVANAIDATNPAKTIGRFWEWFYQSLKFIKDWKGAIVVRTKKNEEQWFSIQIRNQEWNYQIGAVGIEKNISGTEVELDRKLSKEEQKKLIDFVRNSFKTNKRVKIFLNGEHLNPSAHYVTLNWWKTWEPNSSISITISGNWFIVSDNWVGMNSRDISEKLLYPNISWKSRSNPDAMQEEEIEKNIASETSISYKIFPVEEKEPEYYNEAKSHKKTSIRLQVAGVLIEEILIDATSDIEEFCLDFPSFIWLPESRNSIELTKEVILTLKVAIEKIIHQSMDVGKKMILLELIWKIITHLKSKEGTSIPLKNKYDIDKISKTAFVWIKEELEWMGKKVIWKIPWVQEALANRGDLVFVDTQFLSFDITQIPWAQSLTNITGGNRKFYQFEFAESAPYDYLILPDMILVNSRYTRTPEDIARINAQINLNTNYEYFSDTVHYGLIQDNSWDTLEQEKLEIDTDFQEELKIYEWRISQAMKEYNHTFPLTMEELQQVKRWELDHTNMAYFMGQDIVDDLFIFWLFQWECETYGAPMNIHEYDFLSPNFFEKFKKFVKSFSNEVIQLFFLIEPKFLHDEDILSRLLDILSNESISDYIRTFTDALCQVPDVTIWMIQQYYLDESDSLRYENIEDIWDGGSTFDYEVNWVWFEFMLDYGADCILSEWKLLTINWQSTFPYILWSDIKNWKLFFEFCLKNDPLNYIYYWWEIYSYESSGEDYETSTTEDGFSIWKYYIPYSSLEDGTFKTYIVEEDGTQLDTDLNFLTKQNLPITYTPIFDTELDPRWKISDDANIFLEFLCKWGEFLKEEDNKVAVHPEWSLLLTDIIGISRFFGDELSHLNTNHPWDTLSLLKSSLSKKLKNRVPFQRNITTTIDGQDRSSMIWLREVIQNSRDAILKRKHEAKKDIHIDFYRNDNHWVSRVSDAIGMTPREVFTYLLTPWVSWKDDDTWSTGMFGQGFYSLAIGAQEIRVKTWQWNGLVTCIRLLPIYNQNNEIIDFSIEYSFTGEEFQWTIIERVGGNTWVSGSIWALIWKKNLQKYVWNLDDVNIVYNWESLCSKEDIILLQTEQVWSLWILSLKQNTDKQERLTKDNLWVSKIKDSYLAFLPDWIQKYIRKWNYSLDLPAWVPLTKTRNAITDFEQTFDVLKPHIFNVTCRQLIQDYLDWKVQLPMMPLDYYGLDWYEFTFDKKILDLADKVNRWGLLSWEELEVLKDKALLVQYFINLNITSKGEIISLRKIKQERDDARKLQKHTQVPYILEHKAEERNKRSKEVITQSITQEQKDFLLKVQTRFEPIIQRIFGFTIPFWFKSWFGGNAAAWGGKIVFNLDYFFSLNRYSNYRMLWLVTHEMTHLVEWFIKELGVDFDEVMNWRTLKELVWANKISLAWERNDFWTHQKDLEHNHSFERIQRQILKLMTREYL